MIRAHSVLVLAITLLSVAGPAAAAALPSVLGERDSTTAHIVNLIAREEEKKGGISKTVKYILIAVGALVGIIILSVLARMFRKCTGLPEKSAAPSNGHSYNMGGGGDYQNQAAMHHQQQMDWDRQQQQQNQWFQENYGR